MNKRGITLSGFVITLLIVSAVISGIFIYIGEYQKTYQVTVDVGFNNTFAKTEELQNTTLEIQEGFFGTDIESATAEDSLFKGAFKAFKLVGLSMSTFGSMMTELGKQLPIPESFPVITLLIITVLVALIFAALSGVLRYRV